MAIQQKHLFKLLLTTYTSLQESTELTANTYFCGPTVLQSNISAVLFTYFETNASSSWTVRRTRSSPFNSGKSLT